MTEPLDPMISNEEAAQQAGLAEFRRRFTQPEQPPRPAPKTIDDVYAVLAGIEAQLRRIADHVTSPPQPEPAAQAERPPAGPSEARSGRSQFGRSGRPGRDRGIPLPRPEDAQAPGHTVGPEPIN